MCIPLDAHTIINSPASHDRYGESNTEKIVYSLTVEKYGRLS